MYSVITRSFGNCISDLEIYPHLELDWMNTVLDDIYSVVTNGFVSVDRDGYFILGEIAFSMNTYKKYTQSFVDLKFITFRAKTFIRKIA